MLFSYLHYILHNSSWIGFESEKHESLYWYQEKTQGQSIGPVPRSRYTNTTLNHDKVSIHCALLTLTVVLKTLTVVLKLTIRVFLSYIFKHSDRNNLIFFGHFKNISVCDRKNPGLNAFYAMYCT